MTPITHHIIPEDEQYCIWMDAGVVDYKLCNRQFLCEECPFDAQVRTRSSAPHTAPPDAPPPNDAHRARAHAQPRTDTVGSSGSAEECCEATLQNVLRSIDTQELPEDRLYSAHHTWAREDGDGAAVLGIDHFIGTLLSAVHSVAFSVPPTHIRAGEPYAWIVANGETLAVRSPIAGTIVENNHALADRSNIIHTDCYHRGWIARIRPDTDAPARALSSRDGVLAGMKKDRVRYERRIHTELHRLQSQLEGTMYDGGTVLEHFEDILGTKKYFEILERFLRP